MIYERIDLQCLAAVSQLVNYIKYHQIYVDILNEIIYDLYKDELESNILQQNIKSQHLQLTQKRALNGNKGRIFKVYLNYSLRK